MRIKGNEWLRVKQVKEKLVSSVRQRWWERERTSTGEEKNDARKGLGCAGLCLGCTQGCCLMTAGLDMESALCKITRWKSE